MKQNRLYKVIQQPLVSEKSIKITQHNQYAFKVDQSANKHEVKTAIEKLFKVKVEKVNMLNVKPKPKRFGMILGKQKGWKKAYVKLEPGYEIDTTGAQA